MLQLVQDPNMSVFAASLLPKSCPRTRRLKIDVITCTMSHLYNNDYIYKMHIAFRNLLFDDFSGNVSRCKQ